MVPTRPVIRAAIILGALVLSACGGGTGEPPPPPAGAIPPGQSIGSASISGRVLLAVPPPPREQLRVTETACRHGETESPLSEAVVAAGDGALRNVIVHVASGLGPRVFAPGGPATLDQRGCVYIPHVLAVQANQIVTFLNSDSTLHNVHAVTKVNPGFNVGMSVPGQKVSRFFGKSEIVKMKCDVHSWMTSYIGVFDNPYHTVTDEDGRFALTGLPAGTYEIEAWHETYGVKSQSVTLADGESRALGFSLGG